jgi:hypothetical protein
MQTSQSIRRYWAAPIDTQISAFQNTTEENPDRDYRTLEVETWEPELADRITHSVYFE